ncbi:response regulator [Blautia pseudococcoides]|uniref:LytR/AlgR family response regulator transcription factor n=1 Tax=Blautia pseudococcoides TaxID=1796616 RepID=UPI00148B3185|nr:response regulator [Blautia pseudococcoides]
MCYTRSQKLLCHITEDGSHYDLILLDIEMAETDGMELAEKIKPFLPDVKIIFITSHLEYAIDAYELSIFRYVPKNDIEKRLTAAITDAVRLFLIEEGITPPSVRFYPSHFYTCITYPKGI